ncbi:lipoprotein [Roseibium sp.]|uniref:lipoprotein n=1 Tax=Roseibium sp. TaxID=1936156 RepID=UPI003D134791
MKDFRRAFIVMTTRFKLLALLGLCLSLTLAGCGRKGGLDDPGAVQAEPDAVAADPAVAVEPVQAEAPENDKPFVLDFLIN